MNQVKITSSVLTGSVFVGIVVKHCVRFEVFTAVTMKNAVFWDVAPCRSCVNRRSSETSVRTKYTRREIPEDGNLQYKNWWRLFFL
jgi:hypothetical protein